MNTDFISTISGNSPDGQSLERIRLDGRHPVAKTLSKIIPSLPVNSATLVVGGVGSGKTTGTLDAIADLYSNASFDSASICFVSSRCAINAQIKRKLASQFGQDDITKRYTPLGLQQLDRVGPVIILTYHALYSRILAHDAELKSVDFFIFDEVHALATDATFVGFTGALLQQIPRFFLKARRIYLSATPDPILEPLAKAEVVPVKLYQFPIHYPAWKPIFYRSEEDLLRHLESLSPSEKALLFIPTIAAGNALLRKLGHGQLISAETKIKEPEKWQDLLCSQTLNTRFTITTSTLDAGVSLLDPALHHLACSSFDLADIIQQAGRKRLRATETLSVYIPVPSAQEIGQKISATSETLSLLYSAKSCPSSFISNCILDSNPDLRRMCFLQDGQIKVNPLAIARLEQQVTQLQTLLTAKRSHPLERSVYRAMGLHFPPDGFKYLGRNNSDSEIAHFQQWLSTQAGSTIVNKDDFAATFMASYHACFGTRENDRSDRQWGLNIIKRTLCELNWGFSIASKRGCWFISDARHVSTVGGDSNA